MDRKLALASGATGPSDASSARQDRRPPPSARTSAILGFLLALSLVVCTGYAAWIRFVPSCGSCGILENVPWPALGFACYLLALLLMAADRAEAASFFVFGAFCVQSLLGAQLLMAQVSCLLCFGTWALSGILWVTLLIRSREIFLFRHLTVATFLLLAGLGVRFFQPADVRYPFLKELPEELFAGEGAVSVIVIEDEDCPRCEQFRHTVEPLLRDEFRNRLRLHYLSRNRYPAPAVPFFVVGRSRDRLRVVASPAEYAGIRAGVREALNEPTTPKRGGL